MVIEMCILVLAIFLGGIAIIGYYSYAIYSWLSIYSYHILIRDHPHIIHVIHSIYIQLCIIFCWLLLLKLCYCVLLLKKAILIGSIVAWSCTVEPLCTMVTLGAIHKWPDNQGVLIIQVSSYAKAPFGTTTKCVDYAGVHIFKCPD